MYVANPFRRLVIPSEVEESLIIDRQEMSRVRSTWRRSNGWPLSRAPASQCGLL